MNSKNLNVRYRRNHYAKKRTKAIVIICISVVAVLAVLLIFLGNVFGNTSDGRKEEILGTENDAVPQTTSTVPNANGYALSLISVNSGANSLSAYVSRARGLGGNTLGFAARDSSGREIYSSTIAQNTGKQAANSGYTTLRSLQSTAGSLRTSAGVDVKALGTNDAVYRSVLLSYDAGVCAELCLGGVDDVFIRITNGEINEANAESLLGFVDSVKSINPSAVVGLALSQKFFSTQNSDVLIHRFAEKFDFLAYDITGYTTSDGNHVDYVSKCVDVAQLYVMMYNMRVLIPSTDDATIANMIAALRSKSINNWQVYIP